MRGAVVAVLVTGFAGCAEPGPYPQNKLNTFQPNIDQTQVNGPGYAMLFAQGGTNLPVSFTIPTDTGDRELLHFGGQCPPLERGAGIGIYPAQLIAGDTPVDQVMTSNLQLLERGAGVISVTIYNRVRYECPVDITRVATATSTFTFFPSGRINRHDDIKATDVPITSTANCGVCGVSSANFFFTSYWAWDTSGLVGLDGMPIQTGGPARTTCAPFGNDLVVTQWRTDGATRTALFNGPLRRASVFDYDTTAGLTDVSEPATSHVQVLFNTPASMCGGVASLLDFPALRVGSVDRMLNEHGIYVDDQTYDGGDIVLAAPRDDIQGFAVELDIGSAQHVRTSRNDGEWSVQPALEEGEPVPGRVILWFDGGIPVNETITVTPF